MTKQEAKYIAIVHKKMDEVFSAIERSKVGTQAEKDLRRTLKEYQDILAKIKPGTPAPSRTPAKVKGSEDGFKSLI